MAKVNLDKAIGKEPEVAGAKIERKSPKVFEASEAPVAPKTAAAPPKRESPLTEPFPARQNAARPMAGKTPRPTDNRGVAMPPKPEPAEEPPVDAPTWTPDVREPDPNLLPDEQPVPNPDENSDPPMRACI